MSKLIALDDGHGMGTAGKRTPTLPNGEKSPETGKNFMHENEFNRAVVKYLDAELKYNGFRTVLVAPTDIDTSLENRVNTANKANADLYVSVHANANTSKWGSWGGIETFIHPSGESKRIGAIVHKWLMKGTKLRDRGVKNGSHLFVIRKTKMPAILVECGFMDSTTDYEYLLSDAYRRECAKEIAQGICEAYKVTYKDKDAVEKPVIASASVGYIGVVTITTDELNVRSDASLTSKIVQVNDKNGRLVNKTLPKGTSWKVYKIENGMYNVGGNQWISANSKYSTYKSIK